MTNIGRVIHGYCNGYFGSMADYCNRRIESEGIDWIVARNSTTGEPEFACFKNEDEKNTMIKEWESEEST